MVFKARKKIEGEAAVYSHFAAKTSQHVRDIIELASVSPSKSHLEVRLLRNRFFDKMGVLKDDGDLKNFLRPLVMSGVELLSESKPEHTQMLANIVEHTASLKRSQSEEFTEKNAIDCIALLGLFSRRKKALDRRSRRPGFRVRSRRLND